MALAIIDLYNSPERRFMMKKKARQWIVKHYSKDAVIAAYRRVINKVACASKKSFSENY